MKGRARGWTRAGILGLAAVLIAGLALPATSMAKAKKVRSEVDFNGLDFPPPSFPFTFVGNVYAKKPKCVPDRTVNVYRAADDALAGTAVTDRTGDWRLVPNPLTPGDYYAEVVKERVGKAGKKLVCKADVSPDFVLPI